MRRAETSTRIGWLYPGLQKLTIGLGLLLFVLAALPAAAADGVLAEGRWTKGGNKIEGRWRILEEDGQRFVAFNGEFKTRKAPDLKIFLSPTPLAELKNTNATSGSVLIAPLTQHSGAHRYPIDPSVDLGEYQSILIHCEQYSKYWGGAELDSPE